MKKKTMFSLVLLFFSMSVWAEEAVKPPMVEIKCSIKPIDRSEIHLSSNHETAQPPTSPTSKTTSPNWCGYVAATDFKGTSADGTVTYVGGSWTIPVIWPATDETYCAVWVGMDGYLNDVVERIGTCHNWVNNSQQNFAWFEIYPRGVYEISNFPVANGDVIGAEVSYQGHSTFKLAIYNYTQGVSTVIPSTLTLSTSSLRSSAQWIVESTLGEDFYEFQSVNFNDCSAVIDGVSGDIDDRAWKNDKIIMKNKGGVKAKPSALFNGGSSFNVTWKSN